MSAIGPGDWVECVDAAPRGGLAPPPLEAGMIYLVEAIWDGIPDRLTGRAGVSVDLVGVPRMLPNTNYLIERFRPIYRPSESLLRDLMVPVPADPETVPA